MKDVTRVASEMVDAKTGDGKILWDIQTNNLVSIAANVKVLQLPGLAGKEDISDWLDQGHTLEELLDLVATAKD